MMKINTDSARLKWAYAATFDVDWQLQPHLHVCHELVLLRRGIHEIKCYGMRKPEDPPNGFCYYPETVSGRPREKHIAKPGDILFMPAGLLHSDSNISKEPLQNFSLTFFWPDCPADIPIKLTDLNGRIHILLEWITTETREWTPVSRAVQKTLLDAVLLQLLKISRSGEGKLAQATRKYVKSHMGKDITLDILAEEASMSKCHFLRRFKQATGRTPMDEVRRMRVDYARELILTTDKPLKVVAEEAGMVDEHHMTRLFRRYLEITPGCLRRKT